MPERLTEMLMDTWTPLIILWITVLPSIYMSPMNQSQVLPSGSSTGLKKLTEEQRVLNRSKRGWVWNQMFVLEEFSGPEPILVGRLHTDLDPGSSKIKYILSGDGAGTIFVINDKTGDIHAMKRLDREEKAEYTLTAQAVDRDTNKPLEPPSEFIIKVQDINDNAPEFVDGPYHATVPEMSVVGTFVTKVTATDADDPVYGNSAKLVYSILEGQPYFSIEPHTDNTLSILAKHSGFSRQKQEVYLLPIIISDSGNPPMSSTSTLTIRVCGCSSDGIVQSCNVEAYVLPIGLSMGALIAILACIILLLVIVVLFVTLRRHKNEPLIIKDDEDVRENIIRYDDEGGGEEDTEAFDIATLQNPDGINGFLPRKDIKPDLQFMPRQGLAPVPNGVDVDEFINVRLHEADNDPTAPPYDSIQIYGYEGRGSAAGSLSSLESSASDSDQNFDYLSEWGPRFKRLGELYSVGESDKET
ncbi:cadherin-8 isoform X4 [Grus americana]|uniref:cadherin-8 isoform X4 n=1 Tax=Grus americana TaxID=9117 RepID=UPI0024081F5E|nr:cadherin-8 isoform X4 [Grus americana]